MVFDGYLDLAGVEIINSARASAYMARFGQMLDCDTCPDLNLALGDGEYLGAEIDPAPWYDTAVPESAGFLGVVGMGEAGLSRSTFTRSPVPLVGPGSALGAGRQAHREIAFTVGLVARNDRSMSYGIEWLAAALKGAACDGDCTGAEACFFTACPTDVDVAGCDPAPIDLPGAGGELGARELRHLYDVGLLEAPAVGEQYRLSKGLVWSTVTFTLIVGKPWVYRPPVASLTDWVPLGTQPVVGPIDPDAVYDACPTFGPCLEDPLCPPPAMPPRPPMPRDPCVPTGAASFHRALIELDPASAPDWSELVPVIEVSAGSAEMRRLIVRFWTNPFNQPCSDFSDPCTACFDVALGYLPPGALLTVDGRVQRAVVGCPQGDEGYVNATPPLFGARGGAFVWPAFSCPSGICVEVLSASASTARNARVRVRMYPRSDAV